MWEIWSSRPIIISSRSLMFARRVRRITSRLTFFFFFFVRVIYSVTLNTMVIVTVCEQCRLPYAPGMVGGNHLTYTSDGHCEMVCEKSLWFLCALFFQTSPTNGRNNGRKRKQNNYFCRNQTSLWWADPQNEAWWVSHKILSFFYFLFLACFFYFCLYSWNCSIIS